MCECVCVHIRHKKCVEVYVSVCVYIHLCHNECLEAGVCMYAVRHSDCVCIVYVCEHVCMNTHHRECVEVRGQLSIADSLL